MLKTAENPDGWPMDLLEIDILTTRVDLNGRYPFWVDSFDIEYNKTIVNEISLEWCRSKYVGPPAVLVNELIWCVELCDLLDEERLIPRGCFNLLDWEVVEQVLNKTDIWNTKSYWYADH